MPTRTVRRERPAPRRSASRSSALCLAVATWLGACCPRSLPPPVETPRRSLPEIPPDPPTVVHVTDVDGHAVDVEHQYGVFNGLTLHYVTAGPASGKKVFLLHGFPELWYGWRNQIVALARAGYHVFAPDLRGYNRSSKPSGKQHYTIAHVANDIVSMIAALSPGERIVLVGHDWGGSAAFRIAYDRPELLEQLFILNIPHPNQIKQVLRDPLHHLPEAMGMLYVGAFVPKGQPEFIFQDLLGFQNSFNLFVYEPMVHKQNITQRDREIIFAAWARPGVATATANYYRVNFDFPKTFPDRPLPKSLPVVLIFGMRDIFMSPRYMASIDQCQVCAEDLRVYRIPDASHFVHSDTPRKVNDILLNHLQSLPAER